MTSMRISFVPKMKLNASDVITFELPGFQSSRAQGEEYVEYKTFYWVDSNYTMNRFGNGTVLSNTFEVPARATLRHSASGSTITLTMDDYFPPDQRLNITISESAQIRLPVNGVRTNQASITISTQARWGPVPPTPVVFTQSVGSFSTSPAIRYDAPERLLSVHFKPDMTIAVNETILIQLSRFRGQ